MTVKLKTAIVLGSSRAQGNTFKLADVVAQQQGAILFNLADYDVKPYDYAHNNDDDDFNQLIDKLLTYDQILFASPVYWYAPSAQLKAFIDRMSGLLDSYKTKGRQLRGKFAGVIATGASAQPAPCFEQMFSLTFHYLGMHYQGMLYQDCSEHPQVFDESKLQLFD